MVVPAGAASWSSFEDAAADGVTCRVMRRADGDDPVESGEDGPAFADGDEMVDVE
jgi:hypothetical protein